MGFRHQSLSLAPSTGLGEDSIILNILNILYMVTFYHHLHLVLLRIIGSPATLGTGVEPVTFRLTVERSNQLSYPSKFKIF